MSGPEKPSIDRKSTGTPLARKFADLRVVSSSDVPTLGTNGTRNGSTKSSSGLRRAPDGAANDKGEKRENWFSAPNSEHPYELVTIVTSPPHTKPHTWHHAAYFPWGIGTNPAFARGRLPALRKAWEDKQRKYSQVVAICGGDEVRLFRTTVSTPYKLLTCIKLDQVDGEGKRADLDDGRPYVLGDRARALTWAVDPSDLSILLCFGGSARLIYVWDVDAEKYRSCIRGHGQTIMHLTTHPVYPYIIASSSRDRSTRIYDLTLQQSFQITYAPLPDGMPNRGNFPMGGLPVTKKGEEGVEGEGPGKCIAVVGWYVKGHRDAIVGADFHPTLPLLATCGLDHAVRIWALPKLPIPKDKPWEMAAVSDPLFGTRLLHSSPLDSIFWITDDILISKSWDEMDDREGVVVIWQWTELDRFFPPNPSGTGRTEIYWEPNREPFQVRTWDVDNSRLYREIVKFKGPPTVKEGMPRGPYQGTPQAQYTRLAIHHNIRLASAPGTTPNPHIVQDLLLAWGGTSRDGSLMLVNPLMESKPKPAADPPAVKDEADADAAEVTAQLLTPAIESKVEKNLSDVAWLLRHDAFGEMARRVPGLRERVRAVNEAFAGELPADREEGPGVTINTIAVFPRGARWVVGAGEWGAILVWRMKVPI